MARNFTCFRIHSDAICELIYDLHLVVRHMAIDIQRLYDADL